MGAMALAEFRTIAGTENPGYVTTHSKVQHCNVPF
jgi:hypothetical protein